MAVGLARGALRAFAIAVFAASPATAGIEVHLPMSDEIDAQPKSSAALGESFRGGVCAEAGGCDDSGGDLIAAESDDSGWAYYGTKGYVTGATSLTDGRANTQTALSDVNDGNGVYNPPGFTPNSHKLCWNKTANGYGDWHVPSRDALEKVYDNLKGVISFRSDHYWSSTETSADDAYRIDFRDGAVQSWQKNNTHSLRCVRRVD